MIVLISQRKDMCLREVFNLGPQLQTSDPCIALMFIVSLVDSQHLIQGWTQSSARTAAY